MSSLPCAVAAAVVAPSWSASRCEAADSRIAEPMPATASVPNASRRRPTNSRNTTIPTQTATAPPREIVR